MYLMNPNPGSGYGNIFVEGCCKPEGKGKCKKQKVNISYDESRSEERMRRTATSVVGGQIFRQLFITLVMMVFACVQLSISVQILE